MALILCNGIGSLYFTNGNASKWVENLRYTIGDIRSREENFHPEFFGFTVIMLTDT